jgi:hypothetical protein
MGRSKSQGISKYANEEPTTSAAQYLNQKDRQVPNPVLSGRQQQTAVTPSSFGQQLHTRPTLDQYTNPPNDRWSSSYRTQYGVGGNSNGGSGSYPNSLPSSARPYGPSTSNPQYYQRPGGGKEVVLDETISFQGINISNVQDSNSYDSGGLTQSTGGNGNTASSRIRAAINLGNQYNQQVKQRTQVVEDVVAVAKEREPQPSAAPTSQQSTTATLRPTSAGATAAGGYAEMRPRMIKTIHNSTHPTSATSSSHKGNATERTENEDGVDIDDHENGQLDDDDDDILGEGRDGGVGTEEGASHKHVDSRSYGHTTNPEVSTPSLSIELGQQSSLSAHLHHLQNSIDIRNGSSSIEEIPSEYHFKLTTLPNQFCSMKEALELQKIILSCRHDRTAPSNGPAAAALMDMYMVGKIVGVGSYGKVRAAWHRLTSCKVAIKTYDKSKLKDPEHWKRVQVCPSLSPVVSLASPSSSAE